MDFRCVIHGHLKRLRSWSKEVREEPAKGVHVWRCDRCGKLKCNYHPSSMTRKDVENMIGQKEEGE